MKYNLKLNYLIILFAAWFSSLSSVAQVNESGKKIRYIDAVFDEITIEKDVAFGSSVNEKGENEMLKLDIYAPKNDALENRPVILWIHGGGFTYGNDKSQKYIVEMATRFAKKGYVGVSIDYRLRAKPKETPEGTISDAVADALKALEWLRSNPERLLIDPSKIIVAGGSAGGMLSCHLCFNDRPASKGADKAGIAAIVNLWGSPAPMWGELSIDSNDPPTIIVHGTADQLVDYNNSVTLSEKLTAAKVPNQLVTLEGAGHTPVKQMDEFENEIAKFLLQRIE
jgi:acetyl esterase/lipase